MPEHDHPWMHHWQHGHPWDYGHAWQPDMLSSMLGALLLLAFLVGLVWFLLRWVLPYALPIFEEMFGKTPIEGSSLEILRQRYAADEIDEVTYAHMRERLMASYPHSEPLASDDYRTPLQEQPWQR